MVHILFFLLLLACYVSRNRSIDPKQLNQVRYHLLTCETRADISNTWLNYASYVAGAHKVVNVCADKEWAGLIMKPTFLLEYARMVLSSSYSSLTQSNPSDFSNGNSNSNGNGNAGSSPNWVDIIVFIDGSDALFNAGNVIEIHKQYSISMQRASDTHTKPSILISTELTCWMGHECSVQEANLMYPSSKNKRSANSVQQSTRSLYLNAGAFMGPVNALVPYLEAILADFRVEREKRPGYMDDQYSFVRVAASFEFRNIVVLDTNWDVFGSLQFVKPKAEAEPSPVLPMYPKPGYKFTCWNNRTLGHTTGCYQVQLSTRLFLWLDPSTCLLNLNTTQLQNEHNYGSDSVTSMETALKGLNRFPLVLHANGRWTKQAYVTATKWLDKCLETKPKNNQQQQPLPIPSIAWTDIEASNAQMSENEVTSNGGRSGEKKYGVEKIAFLFLTRGPMPHEPIWHRFFNYRTSQLEYNIYVHPPKGFRYHSSSLFAGSTLPDALRIKVEWGGLTEVLAMRSLYKYALNDDESNSYFILASESCIPLHPMPAIRRALLQPLHAIADAVAAVEIGVNRSIAYYDHQHEQEYEGEKRRLLTPHDFKRRDFSSTDKNSKQRSSSHKDDRTHVHIQASELPAISDATVIAALASLDMSSLVHTKEWMGAEEGTGIPTHTLSSTQLSSVPYASACINILNMGTRRSIINACPQNAEDSKLKHWHSGLEKDANITKSKWRKSEQWSILTRKHVEVVMGPVGQSVLLAFNHSYEAWLGDNFKFSDEHYVPTVLSVALEGTHVSTTCAGGSTLTDWSRAHGQPKPKHPKMFYKENTGNMLHKYLLKEAHWATQLHDMVASVGPTLSPLSGSASTSIDTSSSNSNNIHRRNGLTATSVIKLSKRFGLGPLLDGGCSGLALCHLLMRKVEPTAAMGDEVLRWAHLLLSEPGRPYSAAE